MPWMDDVKQHWKELERIDRAIMDGLPAAAEAGAQIVAAEAKVRAPRESGELADSIRAVKVEEGRYKAVWAASVGAFYGLFWEFGFRPGGSGARLKRPFLRPAADAKADRARDAGLRIIRRRVG